MSLPYYSMFPKDFDTDEAVRIMEDDELGLYIRCLNMAWVNNGLPGDPEEIRRALRDQPRTFAKKWARVQACFPIADDGRRRNPRQEEERAEAQIKVDRTRKANEERERKRARNDDRFVNVPIITSPSERAIRASGSVSVSESVIQEKQPLRENENRDPPLVGWNEFLELWTKPCDCCGLEFPCRDVDLGFRAWISLASKGEITPETIPKILSGLTLWRGSKDWHKDGGKFVMSVPKFLGVDKNLNLAGPRWNDRPPQKGEYD